jgi:5-methylcytosine-specific restriction endonuclease McrA
MFDEYTKASKEYAEHVQRLLDNVKEKERDAEWGTRKNRLANLSGLLAKQIKGFKEISLCIVKLDPEQVEAKPVLMLTEDSIPEKTPRSSANRRRRDKKYTPHAKFGVNKVPPKNRDPTKLRQQQNKTRKIRSEASDGCTGKRKLTYDQAIADGSRMLEESRDPSLRKMAIYQCMVCGDHHLTRQIHSPNKKGSTQVAILVKEQDA